MNTRETVSNWLKDIAERSGGEVMTVDENGSAAFEFEDSFRVGIEAPGDSEVVHLYAVIADIPADDTEKLSLFTRLLTANQFGEQTGGAMFAIHEGTNSILLCYNVLVANTESQDFENTLGNFIETAERYVGNLSDTPETASNSAFGDPESGIIRV